MSSLILEKLWKSLEKHRAKLVVITNLPFLFLHSDLPRNEAVEAFDPIVEELSNFRERDEVLLLTAEPPNGRDERGILQELESAADVILDVNGRGRSVEVRLEKHPSNPSRKTVLGPEIPGVAPLEEYGG